jgi:hypothetical protein
MKVKLEICGGDVAQWVESNWDVGVTEIVYAQIDEADVHFPKLPPSVRILRVNKISGRMTFDASPDLKKLYLNNLTGTWTIDKVFFDASISLRVLRMLRAGDLSIECRENSGVLDLRNSRLRDIRLDLDWDLVPLLPWTAQHVDLTFCNFGLETFATRPVLKSLLVSNCEGETSYGDISYESLQTLVVDFRSVAVVVPPNPVVVMPHHAPGLTICINLDVEVNEKAVVRYLRNIGDLVKRIVICTTGETRSAFSGGDVESDVYKTKVGMRGALMRNCPHATVEFANVGNDARDHFYGM